MKKQILALSMVLASTVSSYAGTPVDDYIAASEKYVKTLADDAAANKDQAEMDKADTAGVQDLEKKLTSLLGPLKFEGFTAKPSFSPATLQQGNMEAGAMEGLMYATDDYSRTLIVTPTPIFEHWLKVRAAEEGASEAFAKGVDGALASDEIYTSVFSNDAAFTGYVTLPLKPLAADEKVYTWFGIFAQDYTGNLFPDALVVARVSKDRVTIAQEAVTIEGKPIEACDSAWKANSEKVADLQQKIEKDQLQEDPRWEELNSLQVAGDTAFRTCFAKEAPNQPFYAEVTKQAEGLLKVMAGQ